MNKIVKLRDVLLNIKEFKWNDGLFVVRDEELVLNSRCAVLDPDDVEDDADEEPRFAIDNNLKYALNMQDVRGVVMNAYEQKSSCTENDLLEAFLYYYSNDAFRVLE
ncbi:DUF7716 domain-containing protein [Clostridium estertheticum]|uniref:DUF7716 domain-containing protein n=1 Tax=Clostridium estertheticum TaxID=238834 RepID=A0A5N7J0P8_9CLOT|nr:hypothetical protein [Clostridium estertheticum]MCB2343283.1 hypothetical protein [Clostridium estertheticum]MPQ31651.1 hypothetical protein [Clostridium estertheticum]MPQ62315.1 hypothetical protein [Clostridium estertheticum]